MREGLGGREGDWPQGREGETGQDRGSPGAPTEGEAARGRRTKVKQP